MAVAGYMVFGTPAGLDPANVAGQQGFTAEEIAEMVGTLEARLKAEPDNAEGWMMLARSYLVLQDYPKAGAAYARLAQLVPDDPDVFADWADVVAATKGTVVGDADALAQKALATIRRRSRSQAPRPTSALTTRRQRATGKGSWPGFRPERRSRTGFAPAGERRTCQGRDGAAGRG